MELGVALAQFLGDQVSIGPRHPTKLDLADSRRLLLIKAELVHECRLAGQRIRSLRENAENAMRFAQRQIDRRKHLNATREIVDLLSY